MLQMSTWRNAAFCSLSDTFTSLSLPQRSIPQYQMDMQDTMVDGGQVSLAQSDLTGVSAKRTQPLTTSFMWCCQFKNPPVHDKTQTNAGPIISPTVVPPIISGVSSAHRSASSRLLNSFTSSRKSSGPGRYATLGHTMFDSQLTAWETPRNVSVSDFWVYKTTPPTPTFISFSRRISWVTGRLRQTPYSGPNKVRPKGFSISKSFRDSLHKSDNCSCKVNHHWLQLWMIILCMYYSLE